ncbi:MAG: prepilin peptidase [Clostridiaceae bacterium]|mgnify:CR=1 FL=1|jgi:leader peptidase (prepilin peptidase)/N-methyltransferase|nr:prepilin peptidase [Clostridiaceae bacterium]
MNGAPLTEIHMFAGICVFLLGLCIGSFLNVCIYRIPMEKSIISPPSQCTGCGTRLTFRDLIPVLSYIMLRGRCRYCNARISPRYLLIELLTGFVYVIVYLRYGISVETLALLYLFSILLAVFFIDLEHMIIPNGLVLLGMAGGALVMVYNLFVPFSLYQPSRWYTPLIGMVSASGILFAIALVGLLIYRNDGAMGMGDVKLFIPIGMFLGWKLALLSLFISVMLGGITSIVLLVLKVVKRKSAIPFGPFIVAGSFIAALAGYDILFLRLY